MNGALACGTGKLYRWEQLRTTSLVLGFVGNPAMRRDKLGFGQMNHPYPSSTQQQQTL